MNRRWSFPSDDSTGPEMQTPEEPPMSGDIASGSIRATSARTLGRRNKSLLLGGFLSKDRHTNESHFSSRRNTGCGPQLRWRSSGSTSSHAGEEESHRSHRVHAANVDVPVPSVAAAATVEALAASMPTSHTIEPPQRRFVPVPPPALPRDGEFSLLGTLPPVSLIGGLNEASTPIGEHSRRSDPPAPAHVQHTRIRPTLLGNENLSAPGFDRSTGIRHRRPTSPGSSPAALHLDLSNCATVTSRSREPVPVDCAYERNSSPGALVGAAIGRRDVDFDRIIAREPLEFSDVVVTASSSRLPERSAGVRDGAMSSEARRRRTSTREAGLETHAQRLAVAQAPQPLQDSTNTESFPRGRFSSSDSPPSPHLDPPSLAEATSTSPWDEISRTSWYEGYSPSQGTSSSRPALARSPSIGEATRVPPLLQVLSEDGSSFEYQRVSRPQRDGDLTFSLRRNTLPAAAAASGAARNAQGRNNTRQRVSGLFRPNTLLARAAEGLRQRRAARQAPPTPPPGRTGSSDTPGRALQRSFSHGDHALNRDRDPSSSASGFLELLSALERAERDDELNYSQLLMLQATLLLGGMMGETETPPRGGDTFRRRAFSINRRRPTLFDYGFGPDVDHMSYEELLELEERIGNVEVGVSAECINSKLPSYPWVPIAKACGMEGGEGDPKCAICQSDYEAGELLRKLDCQHCYHASCIDTWLGRKNNCPICKAVAV